jgi:hypothetical protein
VARKRGPDVLNRQYHRSGILNRESSDNRENMDVRVQSRGHFRATPTKTISAVSPRRREGNHQRENGVRHESRSVASRALETTMLATSVNPRLWFRACVRKRLKASSMSVLVAWLTIPLACSMMIRLLRA